ncbi:helix-turn-helix domain-containing protein [Streptomyces ipomoeae]|uniref:helix-turn-helix domain-containing protein n=1 Tax=Streptomyces ipomoeae TaxID=103232 RepID=UPI001FD40AEF|nr:LuxR C-terminal-related transcriptional regulator [Streptomyces ipomoeae]MDX2933541.1 LuxR C-terminal-related transcriptional regulator [Streptomyces ipomoeae]
MYGENHPTVKNAGLGTGFGGPVGLAQLERSALRELTPREREVLSVLSVAEGNRALARRLGIAERTVKAHLTSITRKLGLRNRMEATLLSVQWADELRPSGKSPERT